MAPPTNRFYSGGEQDLRGFDTRSVSPYTFIPNKVEFNLTNPDGTSVPLDPANPALGNVCDSAADLPPGVDRWRYQITANLEYRIPIVNQVTFAFFTDFNMTFDAYAGPVAAEHGRQSLISGASYGCPTIINGACFGGSSVKFPETLQVVPGTNYVPRMSNGAELQVILPIVNAPFRIYYAYNSLRLYKDIPQQLAVPNSGPDNVNTFKSYLPDLRGGTVQLPAGDAVLRGRLHSA